MDRAERRRREPGHSRAVARVGAAGAVAALGTACASEARAPSILRASGLGALDVERFWWVLFGIASGVFAVVLGLVAYAVLRRRRAPGPPDDAVTWGGRFILVAGVLVPAVILSGSFGLTLHEMALLARPGRTAAFSITVVGHIWWWEVRYPNGAVTANEIHIPTGETVRVQLATADVIHSFWVPQLQTKTDMIPGRSNQTWLQAASPGRYRGQCAQFCGLQHANMIFFVVAEPPAQYQDWLDNQARPVAPPATSQQAAGLNDFLSQDCAGCHTLRGTSAQGVVGPDLTHVATRQTIGAGVLANTPGNLAAWITDPQHDKPGVVMPPTQLPVGELPAIVAYLQSRQ